MSAPTTPAEHSCAAARPRFVCAWCDAGRAQRLGESSSSSGASADIDAGEYVRFGICRDCLDIHIRALSRRRPVRSRGRLPN